MKQLDLKLLYYDKCHRCEELAMSAYGIYSSTSSLDGINTYRVIFSIRCLDDAQILDLSLHI